MKFKSGDRARLHSKPHVLASWTGRDGKLRVGVDRKVNRAALASEEMIPREVEGKQTDVVAFKKPPHIRVVSAFIGGGSREYTGHRRPCPGGYSVGHYAITAGTLGCWVKGRDGEWVMLSNNHVLANSDEGTEGDRITQPGPHDLNVPTTDPSARIGYLQEYATINREENGPGGCSIPGIGKFFSKPKPRGAVEQPYPNLIDAAVAKPQGNAVEPAIHNIGVPSGMRPPQVGEAITKTGRTTETTTDTAIEALDLAVQVGYGSFNALFDEQGLIVTESGNPFSAGGDSGSAIIAQSDTALVGLLFAGGKLDTGEDATIFCNIVHVQDILGVSL